jgi:hypothetical protein
MGPPPTTISRAGKRSSAKTDHRRAGKFRFGAQNCDPKALEALDRILRRNAGDDPMHMVADRREIDPWRFVGDAEGRGRAVECRCLGPQP